MDCLTVNKNNEVWKLWNARVTMDVDPVSGLNIMILAHLVRDGVRVADYGVILQGEKAVTAYESWTNHSQLYDIILADAGIEGVDTSIMNNEYD